MPKEADVKIPFLSALFSTVTFRKWDRRYSVKIRLEGGSRSIDCVIGISYALPLIPEEVLPEIQDQVPQLIEELARLGFPVQLREEVGRVGRVGREVIVILT